VVVRYRHSLLRRIITTVFVAFIVLAYAISLISDMAGAVHSP
jgi:hypothetical protein